MRHRELRDEELSSSATPTYVVGFSTWKQYLRKYFPERKFFFIPKDITREEFDSTYRNLIQKNGDAEVFIWGFKAPDFILEFIAQHTIKVCHVEDGFVRSAGLGATKEPPRSLCLDYRTPYFNARTSSDLEMLLEQYDFTSNPSLLERADRAIELLLATRVSKYNNAAPVDMNRVYGEKDRTRILVLGQVEDDASIVYGCDTLISNRQLIELAVAENPAAQIIYKPHPDVMLGYRPGQSSLGEVSAMCLVLRENLPLAQAFESVDHVYTITSLGGFEALLRGIKVTAAGAPFYAGWGLTDDRQPVIRRTRRLTAQQLFAAAYLLYPRYFDPETGRSVEFEEVVTALAQMSKQTSSGPSPIAVPPRLPSFIPTWYREEKLPVMADKPFFLVIPWEVEYGDLPQRLAGDGYHVVTLALFASLDDAVRHEIVKFAQQHPQLFRRLMARRLAPMRKGLQGVIFAKDWPAPMRLIAHVCRDLDITRILIPMDPLYHTTADRWYRDPTTGTSLPIADLVIAADALQRDVLLRRGYPSKRIAGDVNATMQTGLPATPSVSKNEYLLILGLLPDVQTILFCFPTNNSFIARGAAALREYRAHYAALHDIVDYVEQRGVQLIVRMSSDQAASIDKPLAESMAASLRVSIDYLPFSVADTTSAACLADVVITGDPEQSIDAAASNRESLGVSRHYGAGWVAEPSDRITDIFDSICLFDRLDQARARLQLSPPTAPRESQGAGRPSKLQLDPAREQLALLASGALTVDLRPDAAERLLNRLPGRIDVVATEFGPTALATTHLYLAQLLEANTLVQSNPKEHNVVELVSADLFVQWGAKSTRSKRWQSGVQRSLGRRRLILEDGFIRSVDIGLSGEPGLSIIMDDTTVYYDATQVSRLQRLLESGLELTSEQRTRSRAAIDKIVREKVSKYNHAPQCSHVLGRPGRKKVLLLDQRFGDQSVLSGLASERSFENMLEDAVRDHGDWDILIKQHPDAIKGGKSSYFSNERLAGVDGVDNIFKIDFDLNPQSLLAMVDEVYVVTSGMGFEGLMAGKTVHCYGMPFYAGWGATVDRQSAPGRTRRRDVEDLFHFAYIECSRYFNPRRGAIVEVEDIVDYVIELRQATTATAELALPSTSAV